MISSLKLYSNNSTEIEKFLNAFYNRTIHLSNPLYWKNFFQNPLEIADFVAAFVDNHESFSNTNMWVSIDSGIYINIKEDNYNNFIQYLFERFPY
ncbi:MAG: hypothetical protein IKE01_02045 [Clostridia bacterium]|nr:hypothetical protein [Clostridia bacterium]